LTAKKINDLPRQNPAKESIIRNPAAMPLHEDRIKLTAKGKIACRECGAVADISITLSKVHLACPNCHAALGAWKHLETAGADVMLFLARHAAN